MEDEELKDFLGEERSVEGIIHMVMSEVKIRLAANNYSLPEGPERSNMEERWGVDIRVKHRRVIHTCREKPPVGTVKLNTDGSLKSSKGTWGVAIRNNNGDVFKGGTWSFSVYVN